MARSGTGAVPRGAAWAARYGKDYGGRVEQQRSIPAMKYRREAEAEVLRGAASGHVASHQCALEGEIRSESGRV